MESLYNSTILHKYGSPRDPLRDHELVSTNTFPHSLSVTQRTDFTEIPCFTIDPSGCLDADDGFSIYTKGDTLFLAIHIADPTYYINLESQLWNDIQERVLTHYPSNHPPIHMIPHTIMDQASLMTDTSTPKIKKAISIVAKINPETYFPTDMVNLVFSDVKVSSDTSFTYTQATSVTGPTGDLFSLGLKIAKALENRRETVGKKLNSNPVSTIKFGSTGQVLETDTLEVYQFKQMISEFAIFANSFVGGYLRYQLDGKGIFRTCNTSGWISQVDSSISESDLMANIIDNGIAANYLSTILGHDLVGKDEYCHFTSPIRRLADCVCHYLLKYIHLRKDVDLPCPFSSAQLSKIADDCYSATKRERKIGYEDRKFRYLQVIDTLIRNYVPVTLKLRCTGYTGLFLNFIITKINQHKVSISYVLRVKDYNPEGIINTEQEVAITYVNLTGRFDQDKLPQIASHIGLS